MAKRVCPWWLGYLLACPVRRLLMDPVAVVRPYVREGMTVLEPGPGMGFFTVELARLVGPSGRVVAVDVQEKMLAGLRRRLAMKEVIGRVERRLGQPDSMSVDDLNGSVDFVLAFAVVHEMPSAASFFAQAAGAMKAGASLLLAEPRGHVSEAEFAAELRDAAQAGLEIVERPAVRRSHAALLRKR